MDTRFNIVLIEPLIPHNTGSIGRLCLATNCALHLVHPLGFSIDNSRLKRAGLDYWKYLKVVEHSNFDSFLKTITDVSKLRFFTKKFGKNILNLKWNIGDYLIFGQETKGIKEDILFKYKDQTFNIPIFDKRVRSLNLATCVGIAVYCGL